MSEGEGRHEHPPVPPAGATVEPERGGPPILERHRKADGRLLILYRRADGGGIEDP